MGLPAEALDEAARVLGDAGEVTLVCHVNPDADAMGSMLGLAGYLAGRGKKVSASWPNGPGEPPRWLEALPLREHLVAPGEVPKNPDVVVALDAADVNRLGGLGHLAKRDRVICIDHHATNPGFGTVNLVDGAAAATAELVFRLIERMGGPLTKDVAACLYAGLVTDTGRFQYTAATPDVLRIAAVLREQPFDHARLAQALYADNSVAYLRLLGKALDRARLEAESGLVWTYLTRADLEAAEVAIQETDDLIDVIRTAREADVAAVLKEQREGGYKVSLRSRGETDVGSVAASFSGGGHRLAAGFSSKEDLDATLEALRAALMKARGAASV